MQLSPTKLALISRCPYSFKLQYISNIRRKKESANLIFGQIIHDSVEAAILHKGEASQIFNARWGEYEHSDLEYSSKEDWTSLSFKGLSLMKEFETNYLGRFRNTYSVEGDLCFSIDHQTMLYGRTDYVGDFVTDDGEIIKAIVDFKTSSSKFSEDKITFNDQLTAYSIGARMYPFEIDAIVLFVFVKTKIPYIQVIVAKKRSPQEIADFMDTTLFFLDNIYLGRFPKIKSDHCSWCDYSALCTGNMCAAVDELMVRITKYNIHTGQHDTLYELYPGRYNQLIINGDKLPMEAVRKFIEEYNVPKELMMGFEVKKEYKHIHRTYYYWWQHGELCRVKEYQFRGEAA